ncbi:MAG: hypothetical protein EOO29_52115 [Comamonadaceae bacterium]|nr:MAG: hypothetical protein EOO29_52115 [Comamonadaceae bacterium]
MLFTVAPAFGQSQSLSLSSKLESMPDDSRRKLMTALVQRSGLECPAVQRTFLQGRLERSIVWNASCGAKREYGIVVDESDSNQTRVMTCAQLRELGAPACFKKF